MPLSAEDIAALSRLLDIGLAMPPEAQEAWLRDLPAAQQPLVPQLRRMLADDGAQFATMPRLDPAAVPDQAEALAGELVGPYRLIEEIGRGGMGSVWLAERADGIFERQVALKLPRLGKGPRLAERMAHERQIGALLEHPNIARLYDAGIDDHGRPYLVMERIHGTDLITHAARHALDRPARLRLMLQACDAIAHAHRHLVVHRDIKPSNLLVDERGLVKLLDFGIAKLLDADPAHLQSASDESRQTHTPRYAAPEQQHGGAPVTTAMDIYSLGVVLQELLTGVLPPAAGAAPQPAAATLGPDLDRVLACALCVDPARRYTSAERLGDDLRRVLERRPVRAAPASPAHRVRLFMARHRAGLVATLIAAGLVASAGALIARQHARAAEQAQRAQAAREFLMDLIEDAEPAAGQGAGPVTSLQMLNGALERARAGFAGQPVLQGNVLVELGHMFQVLDQSDQALAVLREAHVLLAKTVPSDDPMLHLAQAYLAIEHADRDDADAAKQATSWANAALGACRGDAVQCAKAGAYAHDVLRNLANARGDVDQALLQTRLAVQDYQRGFGKDHAETALAWRSLAVILRNRGDLREAADAIGEAGRIAAIAPLRAADRLDVRMKQALLQLDLGAFAQARTALEGLLAEPAPAATRAEQQRLLAQVLLGQGLLAMAETTAERAAAAGQEAKRPWEVALAMQTRAVARSALGNDAAAQLDIAAAAAGLQRLGLPDASVPRQRVQWFAAEIALRAGRLDAAEAIAQPLVPLAGINRAQWLMLRGVLARAHGDAGEAVKRHSEAAALLAQLPPAHPLRLRNALDLAIAQWLAQGAGDRSALAAARADYIQLWPAGSAWKEIPEARTATPAVWQRVVL